MTQKSSRIPGFYKLDRQHKIAVISEFTGITLERLSDVLASDVAGGDGVAGGGARGSLIENCVGSISVPIGIAPNFKINDKDYLIPMAVEESSVVAAAAYGAKLAYRTGGISSVLMEDLMTGQVQHVLHDADDFERLSENIDKHQDELKAALDSTMPGMIKRGGGVRMIYVRGPFEYHGRAFAIVQFDVDVKDAMGANVVTRAAEKLGELINLMGFGKSIARILSNLAAKRMVRATCRVALADVAPEFQWAEVRHRFDMVQGLAEVDPFRAVTHNKGIMNGVDSVLLATGNDWRAVEAGALGYAALSGRPKPLSHWVVGDEYLAGEMQIPMQVGIVGGMTWIHPTARLCLEILGVQSARELAEVAAAVGLAQNFSAMRALALEGIISGHMRLHESKLVRHHQKGQVPQTPL